MDEKRIASTRAVTPAKAGVQKRSKSLDSGFRRNDGKSFCASNDQP
jgi:hypothetical protein